MFVVICHNFAFKRFPLLPLTDNIKIKVITTPEKFEKMKGKEILSKEDAADFKDLFLNFMVSRFGLVKIL